MTKTTYKILYVSAGEFLGVRVDTHFQEYVNSSRKKTLAELRRYCKDFYDSELFSPEEFRIYMQNGQINTETHNISEYEIIEN